MEKRNPQDKYFATLSSIELATAIETKVREWREWCGEKNLTGLWQKKLSNYYGMSANGMSSQEVTTGGSQGELTMLKVQELHPLLQQQLVTITSQRPAGIARAVNSDPQSLRASRIGTALAEYYMSNANFESTFVQAAEVAILCDESFVELAWDQNAGDPVAVDPETGKPEMSGDVKMHIHAPWHVARDPGCLIADQKWHIITSRMNRFDAAATYPKFATQILMSAEGELEAMPMGEIPTGSDMIYVHKLIHDRTPSVPDGRYSLMIGQTVVVDTVLPFKDYPVERMSPSDVIEGVTGYSSSNDVMALEEATDALHSIILSNNTTFGGQSLVGPKGVEVNHQDLGKGMRYFELPPEHVDKLKPLQLTKSAPETFQYIQTLSSKKEQQLGSVSSVLNAQATQGASGSAMALINAQAISFNSGVQRSYYRLLSACMTKIIGILSKFADTPRVARIVGKSKSQGLKEFKYTGKELSSVSSIIYEMTNPVSQSVGGRITMAQDLIKAGMVKNAKQYINVVTTGNTDVLTEDDESDQILILEENEALSDGQQVQALITEMHADHIKSHMSTLSSVEAKRDPNRVAATLSHVQNHIDLWTEASMTNPGVLMATGQQPLMPPPGAMGPPPGGPGAPQGPGQIMGNGEQPVVQKAMETQQPNMPTNPATNEPAQVAGVQA